MTKQAEIISLKDPWVVTTKYWHRLDDGRVQCDLCPRFCKLQRWSTRFVLCARLRRGQIVLTTYGRSSGYCVDPIEKKPLNHFLPGTPSFPLAPPAATWAASSVRTGTLASPASSTPWPTRRPRDVIARRPNSSVAAAWLTPITTRSSSTSMPSTSPKACRERGIKSVAVTAGRCPARNLGRSSIGTWMPPTSI